MAAIAVGDACCARGAHPESSRSRLCEGSMENFTSTTGKSGDFFRKKPIPRGGPVVKGRLPPELTAARALCRQLRRTRAPGTSSGSRI